MSVRRVGLLVALAVLMSGLGCRRPSRSYHPLQPGARWQYRIAERAQHRDRPEEKADGLTSTTTVLPPRELDGRMVIPLRVSIAGHVQTSFVVEQRNGVYEVAKQEMDRGEITIHDVPACVLPYPPIKAVTCDLEEKVLYETTEFTISGVAHIEADDDVVSVPAGTYRNCLRIKAEESGSVHLPDTVGQATMTMESTDWWAPGVGLIKAIRSERMQPSLGWGTMTAELVSFTSG